MNEEKVLIDKQKAIVLLREAVRRYPASFVLGLDAAADVIRKMKGEQVETGGTICNNAVNLCDSCRGEYPACPAKERDVRFGDGKGRDNICACAFYLPVGLKGEQR